MSTMLVEDFINEYIKFEEDIRRNAEIFNAKLIQEQEIYSKLAEQCRKYKSEQLNEEGLCEDAKVYGEITDINIKKKLEGIKEIIIKVIYNDKSEELHFKIGENSDEMKNQSFGFKPTSRKDHFEFIMKGVNDRNQIFDIGSKVFPLTDINSYEEYIVQIVVPEIDNEEEIAAYIHAKIVLYWSDYKYYEKQKRKAESRLKKLTSATNKANEYLKLVREIYGDLTRKKPDIIVDFNNEKLMQRKGCKLNVNFNNQKEAEASGGNYVVEFNNTKEVTKTLEPVEVEFNNTKEITVQKTVQETVQENTNIVQETLPYITKVEENVIQEPLPYITKTDNTVQETGTYITKVEENVIQESGPYISKVEDDQNVQYLNTMPPQVDYTYLTQTQTETNVVENGGQEYNINQVNGAETITETTTNINEYSSGDQQYGTGGFEYIEQNQAAQLRDVNQSQFDQSTNKTLIQHTTLPIKILEPKICEPIIDNNVKTLPVIYAKASVIYDKPNEMNNLNTNNYFHSAAITQGYTLEEQQQPNGVNGNTMYSANM